MPPRKSPRKRRRSGSDTSGNDQEGKRKKKVPHQSKIDDVFQELLNMLAPATSESLKDFNDWEREEGRRGVVPLHIYWLERKLPQLRTTAAEGIDTKLDDINSFLEEAQVAYEDYIGDPGTGNQIVRRHVKASLGSVVRCIKEAKEMLPDIKAILLRKPPPSEYAKAHNWPDLQTLPNPMLCMRPVQCRGPPIFLLHRAFAKYLSLSKKVLPTTPEARIALHVARELCDTMANHFDNERARRSAFLQTTKPLFSQWSTGTPQGATAPARTNITISVDGSTMLLIEIKNGKEGDAYMQACRAYEITTEALKETNPNLLAYGAPTLIACLDDEELRIAGAFKDGEQIVVEPLSCSLLYPDCRRDGRTMALAQNLFALYSCLCIIAQEINSPNPAPGSAPGCPRVFSELPNTDANQRLEFIRPRKEFWETAVGTIDYRNLVYDARFGGMRAFVKVVPHPSYGEAVHRHLATQGMAPLLYRTSHLEDVASVVVMQLLEADWITLFDYRENRYGGGSIPEARRTPLLQRLEGILDCLGSQSMVHGDFRMANVMLKPGEERNAMLIDFDWAGQAEEARYPVTRSDSSDYPGVPGGPISAEDDRRLYETWKNRLLDN